MNPVSAGRQRNVNTRINQETRRRRILTHHPNRFPRQHFQFARTQIFFAELYVIDAIAGGFRNFAEQNAAAIPFTAAKLASIGNVVEQTAASHFVWRGHSCPRSKIILARCQRPHRSIPAHCPANNFKFSAFQRIAA